MKELGREPLFYRQIAIDAIEKTVAAANSSGMLKHPVLKGRLREIVIEELVTPFLSPHIRTATGTIVDPKGEQSNQIDVILYDEQVMPPILFSEREGVIPCHAVVATIEVKSKVTKYELRNAVDNARSVKLRDYNYGHIPLSHEVDVRRRLDEALLRLLREDEAKVLEHELARINSPACFVFAFTSDLNGKGEENRLREVVNESNQGKPPIEIIEIPLSGLCVADRSFTYCCSVEPIDFKVELADRDGKQPPTTQGQYRASHNVVLKFISSLVNTCSTFASQRWRIPLDVYFEPKPAE